MVLWFAGLSIVSVWLVFRDPAIDLRIVVVGSLVPDVVDALAGDAGVGHTLLGGVAVLALVMVLTTGRRPLRRRLLALPIGWLLHLVLDAAWSDTQVFWWPAYGGSPGEGPLPSIDRGIANVPLELAGLAALVWAWGRFRLSEPDRRRRFVRTGRLGRDVVA